MGGHLRETGEEGISRAFHAERNVVGMQGIAG